MILFDGFSEFSNPEVEILNKLSSVGNTKLYIRFDYAPKNRLIFSHLDKCYDALTALGFIKIDETNLDNPDKFKNVLSEKLFKAKSSNPK